ncbi:MAG: hypothetical protein ACYTGB_04880 [Planctomycetota bacterium]
MRLGKLGLVSLYLARSLVLLLPAVAVIWAAAFACGALPAAIIDGMTGGAAWPLAAALGVVTGGAAYVFGWWGLLTFWPVDGALAEFERFDRLADENFKPELRRGYNPRKLREHIRTRRH